MGLKFTVRFSLSSAQCVHNLIKDFVIYGITYYQPLLSLFKDMFMYVYANDNEELIRMLGCVVLRR